MPSIFTRIINGELPSYKIYEDDKFYAMLDINPNAKGHTLCIPKQEVDQLFDLDEITYLELMAFSRKVADALKTTVDCKRIGLSVIGLEVPHVHVHLIPLNEMKDATFGVKVKLTDEELKTLAKEIGSKIT